jgi:peptide/nickel transport system substrate-binding protein
VTSLRAAALAAVFVLACAPAPRTETALPSAIVPVPGGRVVQATFFDAQTLQPLHATDAASLQATGLLYAPLLRPDAVTGQLRPHLGTWSVSADGRTITWDIEPRASWSDGTPITGEDFATLAKGAARSKKTTRKPSFQLIEGFADYQSGKAASIAGISVAEKQFTVRFSAVFCPSLYGVFGLAPIPAHVFARYLGDAPDRSTIDEAPENLAPAVVSGPFRFESSTKGERLDLARNERYFDGAPLLDGFSFKVVSDVSAYGALSRDTELDLALIEPKDADAAVRTGHGLRAYPSASYTAFAWNLRTGTPALRDVRVRQALAYAIDVDGFISSTLFGHGQRVHQHHLGGTWPAAPGGTPLTRYAHDTAAADALLAQAGFTRGPDGIFAKDGKPLSLVLFTNAGNKARETFLQLTVEELGRFGVKAEARLEQLETLAERLGTGSAEGDGWLISWAQGAEPDPHGLWHSSQIPDPAKRTAGLNISGFGSAELDKAIDLGRSPQLASGCDQTLRAQHYETFNRLLNAQQPYLFAFTPETLVAVPSGLRGLRPGTFSLHVDVHRWWLQK